MNKNILLTGACMLASIVCFGQRSDGTTKSLVAADKDFADKALKSGEKSAFIEYSADNAVVFRPNPVNVKTYYNTQGNKKELSWSPNLVKISKSGDWGFSTGNFTLNKPEKEYGQYLSIWKAKNGKWENAMNLTINHNKPLKNIADNFPEPVGKYTPKLYSTKDAAVGMEIIYDTERTLNTALKSYGIAAFGGFVNQNARLLFPGQEPIIGKNNILAFKAQMISQVNLKTTGASKANGGELAYTYGLATIDYKAELRETFHYVFIWERQADHSWDIIVQMFTPAER